jgi:hypothetical protein
MNTKLLSIEKVADDFHLLTLLNFHYSLKLVSEEVDINHFLTVEELIRKINFHQINPENKIYFIPDIKNRNFWFCISGTEYQNCLKISYHQTAELAVVKSGYTALMPLRVDYGKACTPLLRV